MWAPDGVLDYAELVLRAKALARRLAGIVLEAWAAYLPLDPVYPEQRLAHMLRDSGADVVSFSELGRNDWTFAVSAGALGG